MNADAFRQGAMRKGATTGGGLGSLDVGWLNSRNDNVGKGMEAELWEEARQLIDSAEARRGVQEAQQQRDDDRTLSGIYHQQSHDKGEMDQS